MARLSTLHRLEASLSPAIVAALVGGMVALWLFNVTMAGALAVGLGTGGAAFVGLWWWWGRRKRSRAARRWWQAERGGALIALCMFLAVAGGVRYLAGGSASESVSWGLWIALPLWLLWFTTSLWSGPVVRVGQWLAESLQRQPSRSGAGSARKRKSRASDPLQSLSPNEFEALCARVGMWWGFRARVVGQAGDGGVDVELWRDGEYVIAQCKHYFDRPVGPGHIRDFYGALIHTGADRGFFFTSGYFTSGAEEFARGKPIALIDRTYIENAIDSYG